MAHPLTTAYTTLGPEGMYSASEVCTWLNRPLWNIIGLQHSLHEPTVRLVFTNSELLGTLLKVLDNVPSVVWVVYDKEDSVDQVSLPFFPGKRAQIRSPIDAC